jgi:ketosteroid isomerase-like protein
VLTNLERVKAMMRLPCVVFAFVLCATAADAQTAAPKMPPEIGAAYSRLGKAIVTHDVQGVKQVWAEDFIVNAPNNAILQREEVIAAMQSDLLDYRDFKKVTEYVGQHGDATIVMGHDTMIPLMGPCAGKQIIRRFTDFWMRDPAGWKLVARQATIAAPID